jgi:hypothetical protein
MRPARLSPLFALLLFAGAPALTACQTDSTGAPMAQAAPAAPPEPPTRQEAAMQCWMSAEKAHKDLSLDKRADIVTKCIDDKMNPGSSPAAAAPKPAPKLAPDHDRGPPKAKT